jgi:hypothetical protein
MIVSLLNRRLPLIKKDEPETKTEKIDNWAVVRKIIE